uniref:Uncharacterized protein n=1 Tax=Arundo donax TaxID=35708 RepID=A0A0A9CU34_ARUDO
MRRLYNDIIYFLQNHVEPVPPPPPAAGCRLVELGFAGTSPSPSLSPPRRPHGDDETPVKLFGVRLNDGKKRRAQAVQLEEEGSDGDHGDDDGDDKGSEV